MSSAPSLVRALPVMRWITLGCLVVFSFVVLGASANYVAIVATNGAIPDPRAGFSVAVPVLTTVFISPMLFIDLFRRNAFTSMISVELPVLGFFFTLWLGATAWTTSFLVQIMPICNGNLDNDIVRSICMDVQLTTAFGWLNWIVLLVYFVMLLTISIIGAKKGASVWTSSVRDCDFGYGSSKAKLRDRFEATRDAQFPVKFGESA
ncbi:hypothetical protein BC835DRAFT_445129 [Cytidiella melzeri]|nr:hypothetical protein BC835DRAFT_445129 [Cytidiella melzeri]